MRPGRGLIKVFALVLNELKEFAVFRLAGKLFHSSGAAIENALSPRLTKAHALSVTKNTSYSRKEYNERSSGK